MGVKFSLITPIYNVGKYLYQCIDGMVEQSYENIEMILVDDGSTDDSSAICDTYAQKDHRIKVIHKENGGIVSARQAGMRIADGDYIICVDGDDWIDRDYCKRMNEIIEEWHPDIVCCGYVEEGAETRVGRNLSAYEGYKTKEDMVQTIFPVLLSTDGKRSFPLSLWAKAVKTDLMRKYQLQNVVVNIGEDIACMAACIFHAASIYVTKDLLYHYRRTTDSMTKGKHVYDWDGPEIRGRHIEANLDLNVANLREQHYQSMVIALYTVARSQLNREESIRTIVKDIRSQLKNPYYWNALQQCRFHKNKSGKVKLFVLKHKLYYLIKLIG